PVLLVPEVHGQAALRTAGQVAPWPHVHRLQPDVLPDAPARHEGHAQKGLYLRGRTGLEWVEPAVLAGFGCTGDKHIGVPRELCPEPVEGGARGPEPMGRRHTRVARRVPATE